MQAHPTGDHATRHLPEAATPILSEDEQGQEGLDKAEASTQSPAQAAIRHLISVDATQFRGVYHALSPSERRRLLLIAQVLGREGRRFENSLSHSGQALDLLELPDRAKFALVRAGVLSIERLQDAIETKETIRGVGPKTRRAIEEALIQYGNYENNDHYKRSWRPLIL